MCEVLVNSYQFSSFLSANYILPKGPLQADKYGQYKITKSIQVYNR